MGLLVLQQTLSIGALYLETTFLLVFRNSDTITQWAVNPCAYVDDELDSYAYSTFLSNFVQSLRGDVHPLNSVWFPFLLQKAFLLVEENTAQTKTNKILLVKVADLQTCLAVGRNFGSLFQCNLKNSEKHPKSKNTLEYKHTWI